MSFPVGDPRPSIWRTTPVRLSVYFAIAWIVSLAAVIAIIFVAAASYLSGQGDEIVRGQAQSLISMDRPHLVEQIVRAQSGDLRGVNYYGLFDSDGSYLAGNVARLPKGLPIDGEGWRLDEPGFQYGARGLAVRLADKSVLMVGYDAKTLTGLRQILTQALSWSIIVIVLMGLGVGAYLGTGPMRRVRAVQAISRRIAAGDLSLRLPVDGTGDELDMLSGLVNRMIEEVARLLEEVKSLGDNVAHDLRTPLNRLRVHLHSTLQRWHYDSFENLQDRVELALEATEVLMSRFRALQRLAELDQLQRRSGIADFAIEELIQEMVESYIAVAEESQIVLTMSTEPGLPVQADRAMLAEALANLLDNALKFTPAGGAVNVELRRPPGQLMISIQDNGPGIPEWDKEKVLYRFGRSSRDQNVPGAGLGLAMVTAVVRLHGYELRLEDATPGLRVVISGAAEAQSE